MGVAAVVFLRGVNVGGHKKFQPSALARELAAFDVVSMGAAGTFVVRKAVPQAKLRREVQRRLPFAAEVMICPARSVIELARGAPFPDALGAGRISRYASILAKRPRSLPPLPFEQPAGANWQVRVIAVCGRFALSLHRRVGRRLVYPNEVVEKQLGVPATTRNCSTLCAVCDVLKGG